MDCKCYCNYNWLKLGFVTCEADHTAPRVRNYPRVQCTTFRPVFNANMYIVQQCTVKYVLKINDICRHVYRWCKNSNPQTILSQEVLKTITIKQRSD